MYHVTCMKDHVINELSLLLISTALSEAVCFLRGFNGKSHCYAVVCIGGTLLLRPSNLLSVLPHKHLYTPVLMHPLGVFGLFTYPSIRTCRWDVCGRSLSSFLVPLSLPRISII